MEEKSWKTIKTGLMCGIAITAIYLILSGEYQTQQEKPPTPPLEYYVSLALSLAQVMIEVAGLALTGVLAIKYGGQAIYYWNDAASTGALAGASAFVPLIVSMFFVSVINTIINPQMTAVDSLVPGISAMLAALVAVIACCCLPAGAVISMAAAAIGVLGYAALTSRLERTDSGRLIS